MKTQVRLICFLFLIIIELPAYNQVQYYWGLNTCIGNNAAKSLSITSKCIDSEKNTYIVGSHTQTNINIQGYDYPNPTGFQDAFFIKIGKDGNVKWHYVIQGAKAEEIVDVCLDSNENPIITGFFGNDVATKLKTNGIDVATLDVNGTNRTFFAHFDKNGNILEPIKYFGKSTSGAVRPTSMLIDGENIILSGIYTGTVDLDIGSYSSVSGKFNLFISKFDNTLSVKSINSYASTGTSVAYNRFTKAIKTNNYYYFIGNIYNKASIDIPTSLLGIRQISNNQINTLDFFIYQTDLNLNGQWVLFSKLSGANSKEILGGAIDNTGNLYLSGYNSSSSFEVETMNTIGIVSSKLISNYGLAGTSDIYILKYNSFGKLLSYKTIGDSYNQSGYDIQSFGNKVVQSGYFNGSLIFGKDTLKSSSTTDQNGYLALFDTTNLTPIGAVQIKGTGTENAEKFYYNGSDFNPIIGTLASTAASSVTLKTAGGDVVLTNTAGKSIYVANACPIIGIFENTTTTNLYVNPSKPQTGTIELDVKGDVLGGYSYQWSKKGVDFSRSSSLTDLGPDTTYTVRVDYLGSKCSKTRSFTVLRSITEKSTAFTNSTSCAAKDGTITAVVTNNTNGKYTVVEASIDSANWITGTQSGNDYTFKFTGLTKGDYQLFYRLTVGASMYHSLLGTKIFINEAGNLITWNSTTVNPIRCNGNTGSITVSASTTSGSLTYSVTTYSTPNYIAQNSYSNLTAGTYYINITDGACQYRAAAVNLTNPAPLTINNSTNISTCYSGTNGGISVKAEGGTPSYQYQLTDGVTTTAFQPSNVFSGLAESTNYTVTVKDVYGCTYTTPAIDLESLTSLISISPTSIVSHYYNSIIPGKIIVIPQGGINSTFTYNINPTGYTQTQSNFENLLPNNYNITILHNAGCSYSELFTIKDLNQAYPLVYRKPN